MKLTIFAATGGIGRHALDLALAAGHTVTAVVRNPASLPDTVHAVQADLRTASADVLESAVAGSDAVLSGLGPRSLADAGITSRGTFEIVNAMRTTGVRRLVIVTAAPVGTVASPNRPDPPKHDPGDGPLVRYALGPIVKRVLCKHYTDLAITEDILRASDLQWTIIRPPRLTDKPLTGDYRTALDRNIRGGLTISRANVAHLMLNVLDQTDTIGHTIGIANG